MNRKVFTKLPVLLFGIGTLICSCTNDKYDLNELDLTLGLGSKDGISIPTSSTNLLKISDIFELGNEDCVSMDDNGDYIFHIDKTTADAAKVTIAPIVITNPDIKNFDIPVNVSSTSSSAKRRSPSLENILTACGLSNQFKFIKNLPTDVVSLNHAGLAGTEIKLTVRFPEEIQKAIAFIDEITFTLPSFMTVSKMTNCAEQNGNTFTFRNIDTKKVFETVATITRMTFDPDKPQYSRNRSRVAEQKNNLWIEDGENGKEIKMEGQIDMALNTIINGNNTPDDLEKLKNKSLSVGLDIEDIVIDGGEGNFDPKVDIKAIGNTTIENVPDFLTNKKACTDIYNPKFFVEIDNPMDMRGAVDAKLYAYNKANELICDPIDVKGISVDPMTTTTVCICRINTNEEKDVNYVVEVENLSSLIEEIPDRIEFKDVLLKPDTEYLGSIELGKEYIIEPSFSVNTPIALGKKAVLIYEKDFNGWQDDLKDYDVTAGSQIIVSADIDNTIPAFLEIEAEALDINGKKMSDSDIKVEVRNTLQASRDGKKPETTPLEIVVTPLKNGIIKKLDGLKTRFSIKATNNGESVTGITINGKKQYFSAKNISVKIVGKAIIDAN